jgi:hypothetical protein
MDFTESKFHVRSVTESDFNSPHLVSLLSLNAIIAIFLEGTDNLHIAYAKIVRRGVFEKGNMFVRLRHHYAT